MEGHLELHQVALASLRGEEDGFWTCHGYNFRVIVLQENLKFSTGGGLLKKIAVGE